MSIGISPNVLAVKRRFFAPDIVDCYSIHPAPKKSQILDGLIFLQYSVTLYNIRNSLIFNELRPITDTNAPDHAPDSGRD